MIGIGTFTINLLLSYVSLAEGLSINGFDTIENIPRFLPDAMQSNMSTADFLILTYLRLPFA